jgi:hypothetical protein
MITTDQLPTRLPIAQTVFSCCKSLILLECSNPLALFFPSIRIEHHVISYSSTAIITYKRTAICRSGVCGGYAIQDVFGQADLLWYYENRGYRKAYSQVGVLWSLCGPQNSNSISVL